MSDYSSVGGRGKRAPYNTVHIRIPEPLKPEIMALANAYRELVHEYQDAVDPEVIARTMSAIACRDVENLKQENVELKEQVVKLEEEIAQIKLRSLNQDARVLVSRVLKQSLKLKANSDEPTKNQIRDILTLLNYTQ